jgi:O-antigen/teichoic acid export membrane protein
MSTISRDRLGSLVLRGVGWKFLSQFVLQISRVAVGLTLAHLLSPRDYGLAGMVLILSGLVLAFSDLALGAALVQRRELTEDDRSTVFWTGLAVGATLTAVGIALSGPVSQFFGEPQVAPLFAAFSVSFVVTSLGTTQKALLTREMNFRSLELRLVVGSLCGGAIGIVIALGGHGAWALIAQQLTIAIVSTVLLWVASPWRPSLAFSWRTLREFGGYSGSVFGTRLLYYMHENAMSVLIGRFLGAAALGVYALAYTVILMPLSRIAIPIGEVLFPAFSRMQDDRAAIADFWLRAIRMLGAVVLPSMLGLIIVAPEFVEVVLGQQWVEAVPVIQILAWVGLVQALQAWNSGILMGLDRAGTLFRFSAVSFVVYVAAFVAGLSSGIVGVALCYAVASTLLELVYLRLTARALALPLREWARALSGVGQAALLMTVALVPLRLALVEEGLPPAGRLAVLIFAGIAVFAAACLWRAPDLTAEVRTLRSRRAGRPAVAAPSLES